jgi:predicted RNase H-like HicB family nuclease
MLNEFLNKKLESAKYKILEDGTYFGEVPKIRGVWADARNLEGCRKKLAEVLEEWLVLKIRNKESIPGFKLKIKKKISMEYA